MIESAPNIMIIAGEASGDLNGAALAEKLRQKLPRANLYGVGGKKMHEAEVRLIYDSSSWSAIGISEGLKLVPRLSLIYRRLCADLKATQPDLLVLIDFGFFNTRIGRFARSLGIKVLYYFPPSSWYSGATYDRLIGTADRIVTPFPWSADALKMQGFQADFFGHPLLDTAKPALSRDEFYAQYGFNADHPVVGLLPGSRTQEIMHNTPSLIIAASMLFERIPDLQFVVPIASSVSLKAVAYELSKVPWLNVERFGIEVENEANIGNASSLQLAERIDRLAKEKGVRNEGKRIPIKLLPGLAADVLAYSRAAAITSGTATIQAAVLGCPMVIIYRGSRIMALEFKVRGKNIKFIGMPNIILDRCAFPELIQEDASPENITECMSELIEDSPKRADMLQCLAELRTLLGESGAVDKTADVVLEMLH